MGILNGFLPGDCAVVLCHDSMLRYCYYFPLFSSSIDPRSRLVR